MRSHWSNMWMWRAWGQVHKWRSWPLPRAEGWRADPWQQEGRQVCWWRLWTCSPYRLYFLSRRGNNVSGECVMLVVGMCGMSENRKQ